MNQISDKDPGNPHSSPKLRKKILKQLKIYDGLVGKSREKALPRPFDASEADFGSTQHLFHLGVCYHYKLPQETRENPLKAHKSDPEIMPGRAQPNRRKSSAPGLLNARHPFARKSPAAEHLASSGRLDHLPLQSGLTPILEANQSSLE